MFVASSHPLEIFEHKKNQPPFVLKIMNDNLKKVEKILDLFKYSEDGYRDKILQQINNAKPFLQIPISVVSGEQKMPLVPQKSYDIHFSLPKETT